MISGRPGGRDGWAPAVEAGGKIQNFQNYYCYNNNNNSRLLGRPIFNITINNTNYDRMWHGCRPDILNNDVGAGGDDDDDNDDDTEKIVYQACLQCTRHAF